VCYILHSCTLGAVVAKTPVILCFQHGSRLEHTFFRGPQFPKNRRKVEKVFHFRAKARFAEFRATRTFQPALHTGFAEAKSSEG